MYLMFADESGDPGLLAGSSPYFCISGIVLHDSSWLVALDEIIAFRRVLRQNYGLKLREEIHCYELLHTPKMLLGVAKWRRLQLLRDTLDFVASRPFFRIVNVLVKKVGKVHPYDVFDRAWAALIQRFHNTIVHGNYPTPAAAVEYGMLVADRTNEPKLRRQARKMRRFNVIPSKVGGGPVKAPTDRIVEDPVMRDSAQSLFIQLADVVSYFLNQRERPSSFVKQKGAANYFNRLAPVLSIVASPGDPFGVVRL